MHYYLDNILVLAKNKKQNYSSTGRKISSEVQVDYLSQEVQPVSPSVIGLLRGTVGYTEQHSFTFQSHPSSCWSR